MKTLIACSFTSVWDDDTLITSPCKYDPDTGEVFPETSPGPDPKGSLTREYITLPGPDEEEVEVCTTCHGYVMKVAMNPGQGHDLNEESECSDPDCESHC